MKPLISAIVPCYNEEEALPYFYKEICRVSGEMEEVDFEFLFIDDGSSDNTLAVLRKLAAEDRRVRYISFSRNFGKEAAMYAGFQNCRGDYAAVMDADLQDPPARGTQSPHRLGRETTFSNYRIPHGFGIHQRGKNSCRR